MKSCLETVFQTGKYKFIFNSFLNLLGEKHVPCSETIMITCFKDYVLLLFGLDASCAESPHYEY